jgi:hypothetical protein
MNDVPTQPRPVVDTAATETRTGRIIAAVGALLGAVPALLISFEVISWTGEQVAQYALFLGLLVGLANVLAGQQVKANALAVEAQVTPIASPQLTQVVPLTPGK